MNKLQPLQGSCSCGRYNYVVVIPEEDRNRAQVHFRTDYEHRRSQAALLTAFLKVPLTWYSSNTISFFPDETHTSISRTFSPAEEPHAQRKFCGYCGTHLTYWTEEPREEQDFLNITLGSLKSRDLDTLQDLELLPETGKTQDSDEQANPNTDEDEASSAVARNPSGRVVRTVRRGTDGPLTWFEEMLDGSQVGRSRKTRRGMGTSADGTTTVSWEISEFGAGGVGDDEDVVMTSTGSQSASGSKRKITDMAEE